MVTARVTQDQPLSAHLSVPVEQRLQSVSGTHLHHRTHVGTCPECQRERRAQEVQQIADATAAGLRWLQKH